MSGSGLPDGLIVYGPDANCTLALCPVSSSVYGYRPTLPGNATILALFALTIPIQLALGISQRAWFYTYAIVVGSIVEIIGYAGRIMLYNNPFNFSGFLMQIICITFAPVFYSAAIYVTLARITEQLDPSLSRFSPKFYYWLFIPCDIVSLILQATGGSLSSKTKGGSQAAIDVSIAGLAFQVFTLTVFVVLALDYAVRYYRHVPSDEKHAKPRLTTQFRISIGLLSLAILTIWIRCCYRIDELSGGYTGPNVRNESLFIGLESSMMLVAVYALVGAGPGLSRKAMTTME